MSYSLTNPVTDKMTRGEKLVMVGAAMASLIAVYVAARNNPILPCFSFTPYDEMTPVEKAKCDHELAAAALGRIAMVIAVATVGIIPGVWIGHKYNHPYAGAAIGAVASTAVSTIAVVAIKASKHSTITTTGTSVSG